MSCLDDVPFRMSSDFVNDSAREKNLVCAPESEMPNCAEILMCTMPDFSLEKKVLYWIESASKQETPWLEVTTEVVPTAPPCWLLLVDPKESGHERVAPRCVSLGGENEDQLTTRGESEPCPTENKDSEDEGSSSATSVESDHEDPAVSDAKDIPGNLTQVLSLPQPRPKTSPIPSLAPSSSGYMPRPPLVKQNRSILTFDNVKSGLGRAKGRLAAFLSSLNQSSPTPTPPSSAPLTRPLPSGHPIPPIKRHKPTIASLSPYSCLPPPPGALQSVGSHQTYPNSAADLLSALSQEERDLIEPVLALGYPIHRAILALQNTGRQSLGQFLSYLSACDKLLKQGFEEAQVEEAMEMFQNSEKAAEFLHLLAQFDDMGFQQADIKEVLLLCENQRESALEELMTRAQ